MERQTAPRSEYPGGFRLQCSRTAHSDAKGTGCAPVGPPAAAASQDDTCAGEASAHPSAGMAAGSALWKPASLSQHMEQRGPLHLRVPRDQGRRAANRVRSAGPVMKELLLLREVNAVVRAFPLLCAVSNWCVPSVLGSAARPLSLFTLAASSDAEKQQRARCA